ncbi:unnamed protein product, partial [Amoebophrya sp. A120]|eukprot:GSA120T00013812001.1
MASKIQMETLWKFFFQEDGDHGRSQNSETIEANDELLEALRGRMFQTDETAGKTNTESHYEKELDFDVNVFLRSCPLLFYGAAS